uniref:Putative nuclease HARBI1 n=1 Tax=Musca domestica TaxID=7370 RepID=A0A1I8NJZ2_MUSDO
MAREMASFELEDIYANIEAKKRAAKTYRERVDYLQFYDEREFMKRFRISKRTFQLLLQKVGPSLQAKVSKQYSVSPRTKLLITLRFYASGSFLITVGDFCGVSVSTASRLVKETSHALASMAKEYIKFPFDAKEMQQTSSEFFAIAKFPKVIGAIDCTHVRIQSPGGDNGEIFRNRKGYFSFNVQAVCNAKLMFHDLVARWPGSAHDSNIFQNSRLKFRFEEGHFQNYVLLGDSGYKQCKYMMTPLLNPCTGPEALYNESQIRTRNTIERCFGVWKRRFPVLSMGLRLATPTKMSVIVACAVLHNIAIIEKDLPDLVPEDDLYDYSGETQVSSQANSIARTILIENYFTR